MSARKRKVSPETPAPKYRVRVTIDQDWIEDGSDGKPLPEDEQHYSVNQIIKDDGTPLSYADYLETYGNPDKYTGYNVDLEQQCACCGEWKMIESIGTSLYLNDEEWIDEGVYTLEQAPKYFAELAREMMP